MLLICVVVIAVSFDHTAATAQCDGPVCPGDTVSCDCTSVGVHTWRGTAFNGQCSREELTVSVIISSVDEVGEKIACGIFTVTVTGRGTQNEISSELTFTVSPDLNGTTVICNSPEDNDRNTIIIHGPEQTTIQQARDIHDGGSPTSRDMILRWTVPDPTEVSRYVISCTASPPDPQCDSDTVLPAGGANVREFTTSTLLSVEYVFGAELDVEYSITVRTDNCHNRQNGTESEPLTLALRVPGAVEDLHLNPVYDSSSGDLLTVNIMWDKVLDPVFTGVEEMTGHVLYYTVTVTVSSTPAIRVYSSSECVSGTCSYEFDATGLIRTSQVSVSVAAVSGIGSGPAHPPLSVVFSNNVLAVTLENDDDATGWGVTCSFLSAFPGSDATCRIDYGTDSSYTNLPYSDESTETGGANDSVSIQLQRLNSTTTYYYRVSAIESGGRTITVQGSFIIKGVFECSISDLIIMSASEQLPSPDSRCGVEADTLPIPNGEVCYTAAGTTPCSTAVYYCNSGHHLEGGTVRVCQANGLWSGEASTCLANSGLTTATAVSITFSIMFIFSTLSVFLLGVLTYHCLRRRKGRSGGSHSQSPEPTQTVGPIYEEVIPEVNDRRESIELAGNIAYGPTATRRQ